MKTFIQCALHAAFVLVSVVVFADQSAAEDPNASNTSSQSTPQRDSKLETVVTATRTETPSSHVGSTVTVISGEELKAGQYQWVSEALRQVPGVDVVRSGSYGAVTSVFIRGANSNHTLALVDGVELADPSNISGLPDFSDFPPENIDRIEVLRGPASSLYGSDAIGGVINIITRQGSGPPRFNFTGEGGSYQTVRGMASVSGGTDWVNYALSASSLRSDGISSNPLQTRPYLRSNLSARVGTSFLGAWKFSLFTHYLNSRTNIDDIQNGRAVQDPDNTYRVEQLLMRPELRGSMFQGRWQQTLGFSWAHSFRSADNLPDIANPNSSKGRFLGIKTKLDWQHQLTLFKGNVALMLLEAREDTAKTSSSFTTPDFSFSSAFPRTSVRTYAVTAEDRQQLFESLYLTGSARWDHHDLFGDVVTQSVAVAYELALTGTRFHLTEGTGFKAPSLLQLRDPQYGNKDLRPERSQSFDGGIDQAFFDGALSVGSTIFTTDITQLIGFDPLTFKSININAARITGLENFARVSYRAFRARVDYTWMHPLDRSTGRDLVRRPRHKVNVQVGQSVGRLELGARLTYVGARDDVDFTLPTPAPVSLGSYFLLTATAQYQLTRNVAFFGRVENALNEHYEEVRTFPVPSRTVFLGARVDL
jgi:vitamin B12 transporter